MSPLISHLLAEPYRYGLFQAISLLERHAASKPHQQDAEGRALVQLKAHVSMAFPSADIHAISPSETDPEQFELYTPLMCLAGATGPLPQVFTELLLASRRNKDKAPLDFLDIFNHRLIYLLYQVKQKYHLALGTQALKQRPVMQFVDAAASLGATHRDQANAVWLRHASLQGAAPRAIEGLVSILRDRLGITFQAEQFFGVWLNLAVFDHAALGAHPVSRKLSQLGANATLGQRAWDQSAAFLLKASPLAPDVFHALLPGQVLHRQLKWLVDRHQSSPRKVCVELTMDPKKYKAVAMGRQDGPRLGLTSWLSSARATSTSTTPEAPSAAKLNPCRFWLTDASAPEQAVAA
jgi:type VI secretion system protein ImpH